MITNPTVHSVVQFLAFSIHFEPKSIMLSEDSSAHANLGAQWLQTLQFSSVQSVLQFLRFSDFPYILNPQVPCAAKIILRTLMIKNPSIQLFNSSHFPYILYHKVPCSARIILRMLIWGPNDYKPYQFSCSIPCIFHPFWTQKYRAQRG